MFEDVNGLDPALAARWTTMAEQSLGLLAQGSMEDVQQLLVEQGAGELAAVAITRELIGGGSGSLAKAKEIVLTSNARRDALKIHEQSFERREEL